jgi:hypothetical protein
MEGWNLFLFFQGIFYIFCINSTLLHLPPIKFHCWDRTQDYCDFVTLAALEVRRSNHPHTAIDIIGTLTVCPNMHK